MYHNIEHRRSRFRRDQYVGYADMIVWHIRKSNGSSGSWLALPADGHGYSVQIMASHIYARTLKELSAKLTAWRAPVVAA